MKTFYRQVGLLGLVTIVALVSGALLQHFTALPGRYTWLEPVRTLRLVFDHEWTPASFLVTYLVGLVRVDRGDPRRLVEVPAAPARVLAVGIALGLVDVLAFPAHNGLDVAAVVFMGVTIARRMPPPGERALFVGHGLFAALAFAAICYSFSVTKALTLVGREQADPALIAVEKAIFGVELHKVVAAYAASRPSLVLLCDWTYFRLFHHMALTTVLLLGMRQRKERFEFLGALGFCYFLGGPLYHLLPGVGPSYYDQEAYAFLADLPLATNGVRAFLFHNTSEVLSGEAEVIKTWGYVACMPSLHIAHELVMLYYARRSKIALAISSVFTSITLIAVVVLGWHYAIDSLGGLALAAVAIAVARWQRDRMLPAMLAPQDDEPLPERRSLRAWLAELRPSIALPSLSAAPARVLGGLAVGAVAVRLVLALADLELTDRLFVPDYAYYTLSVARSLAHGLGPSIDGVATSGFQPLLAFLTAPAFLLTDRAIVPVVWVFVVSAIADGLSVWLLGRLATRVGGPLAGLFAAAMWAVSPLAIANALDGLETSLALACQLAMLETWSVTHSPRSSRGYWLTGVFAGLALLARIDSAFVVLALGVVAMRELKDDAPLFARIIGGAALVVSPWWLYASMRFGSPLPEGAAALHLSLERVSSLKALVWLGGALAGGAIVDLPRLRLYLLQHDAVGLAVLALVLGAGVMMLRRWVRQPIVLALTVHAAAITVLYVAWLPAVWFFRRYLEGAYALVTLGAALVVAASLGPTPAPVWRRLAGVSALVLAVGFGLSGAGRILHGTRLGDERGASGAKGSAQAARDVMELVPDGAVVGAFESGALAYFARPGVRVVNLSGVVDGEARGALEGRQILDYAAARGVTHLADTRANLERLQELSTKSVTSMQAAPIGQARPQPATPRSETITLYAVRLESPR